MKFQQAITDRNSDSRYGGITGEVLNELERAMRKFPTWPTDPLHALAVLGEEFGELTKDVLQLTYEPHKTSRDNVRTEAIQTAAMALRFAASLDAYEYARGVQHAQDAASFGLHGRDAWEVKVHCSKGERTLRAGMQWRDALYGSTWELVEPTGQRSYGPSGLGGTPTFWCKPVGELPLEAKRWESRADGCVEFCGDSIAAMLLEPAAGVKEGS